MKFVLGAILFFWIPVFCAGKLIIGIITGLICCIVFMIIVYLFTFSENNSA